jgi:hypothetical protein
MRVIKSLALAGVVAVAAAFGGSVAQAGFAGRQVYGGWQRSGQGYYFSTYYYKPYADYPTYCYNYAIWYPATPRYVYYFNPYRGTYWGRFDVKTKGYSLLAEQDRAGKLKDIPESAFPGEGALPPVPDSKDKLTLAEPPDLPAGEELGKKDGPVPPKKDEATGDKKDDLAPPAPDKTDDTTVDPKQDKPAPPLGGDSGPADKTPPTGDGVVPPPEPTNPGPNPGPTTTGSGPNGAPPVNGSPAPRVDPVTPVFPSSCNKHFGGCSSHRSGW